MNKDKAVTLSRLVVYFNKVAEEYASWYQVRSPG